MRSGEPCSAPADRRKSCVDSMPSCPSNLMVLPRLSPETIPSPHVSDRGSLPEQISTRPTVVSPPTYGDDSETTPPRVPKVFINPESDPENVGARSMQTAHAVAVANRLKPAATARRITA